MKFKFLLSTLWHSFIHNYPYYSWELICHFTPSHHVFFHTNWSHNNLSSNFPLSSCIEPPLFLHFADLLFFLITFLTYLHFLHHRSLVSILTSFLPSLHSSSVTLFCSFLQPSIAFISALPSSLFYHLVQQFLWACCVKCAADVALLSKQLMKWYSRICMFQHYIKFEYLRQLQNGIEVCCYAYRWYLVL